MDENIKRLEDTNTFFEETKHEGKDSVTVRGLRTVASKHILKPENLVMLGNLQLEDDIDWILRYIERYNTVLANASNQLFIAMESSRDVQQAREQLHSRLFSEFPFRFLHNFLKQISQRLTSLIEH